MATIQEFLALLKDVKQNGSGFMAKCPVHDDWEGSLAISEGDDGRILLNCFAGCETRDIVAAVGLKMKDLFPNNKPFQNKGARRQDKPFTVEDLAKDKGLPVPFLESLGVQNIGNGVKITYYTAQGKPNTKQRFRWSLAEKPVWSKKGKTVICYGGWRIKEMAEKHDYMIFVEGESDSWTLWHHDLPAIGVPGADMGKLIAIGHIKPFDRVYIWKEHGKSGETFLKSVPSRLAKLGYQGEVFMIQSPEYDDPSDLHKATMDKSENKPGNSGAFLEKWQEILAAAEPVDLQRLPEDPAAANNKKDNSGPHRFFIGKSFTPSLLGDALLQELHIKKGYDQLWIYVNGVYKDYAERIIRKRAVEALEEEYRPARVEAVYKYIFDLLPEEEVTTNKEFINLKNGRLEWKTKKLHPHDPLKFEITQLPVNYMPSAVCPNFDNYLKTTLDPSTHPLISEVLGYVLIPDTKIMQKAFMFTGAGANGKGVLLDIVEALLGSDNVSHVSLQTLEEDKFKSAELLGKLANIFADLDSSSLKGSSSFKTLTAGDAITGERKYGHPFKFRNYARLLFSANEIPGSRDRTYAFYRRWIIIPFEKTFKEGENADVNLTGKLTTPEELSGVLNRALEGLKRLFANSKPAFTIPQKVSKALDEYQKKNDIVAEFVDECVEKLPAGRVVKRHFYKTFKLWCDIKGYTRLSERVLKEGLERIYPDVGEVRSTDESGRSLPRCWTGIILNDNAPDPEPEESSFYGDDHDDKPY